MVGFGAPRGQLARLAAFGAFCSLATVTLTAGVQFRVEQDAFAALSAPRDVGAHVRLEGVPLGDGPPRAFDLERFEVWSKSGHVVVYGKDGPKIVSPPSDLFYRGTVVGEPDSLVFLSASDAGVRGFTFLRDEKYSFRTRTRRDDAGRSDRAVYVESIASADELPPDGQMWRCELDKEPLRMLRPIATPAGAPHTTELGSNTARYVLNIAVDTDYALFSNFNYSPNPDAVVNVVKSYVSNVVAAASVVYQRDLNTELRLVYTGVYDYKQAKDPFTVIPGGAAGTAYDALAELGSVWHAASSVVKDQRNISRSAVILMSGKPERSGTAWVGTMCSDDFPSPTDNFAGGYGGAYAFCGGTGLEGYAVPNTNNVTGSVTTSPDDMSYWTLLEFMHELGHVVQSRHTHCVALSAADQMSYGRATVDTCYSGEDGCYSNGTFGPVNANVPREGGTIMSYCQLTTGGGTAIRYTFGKPGEASHLIVDNMKQALSLTMPSLSSITTPSMTIASGDEASAWVTPLTGVTYEWSITNGSIVSQANGNVVFKATGTPAVLTVTATNGNGCSATDSASIQVCVRPLISQQPSVQASGSGINVNVITGSSDSPLTYQWYIGLAGDPVHSVSTGGNSSTISVVATNTATQYWVRITNSCGYTDSSSVTVKGNCIPGDVNGDGNVTVADIFYLVNYLFTNGPPPLGNADANGDGIITVADVFYLTNFLFEGGPAPKGCM